MELFFVGCWLIPNWFGYVDLILKILKQYISVYLIPLFLLFFILTIIIITIGINSSLLSLSRHLGVVTGLCLQESFP